MKKRIIAIMLLIVLVITNYTTAVTAEFIRSGGNPLKNVATIINENTYIDGKYSAQSNRVTYANVNVYEYGTENPITLSESNLRPIDRVIYYKIPMTSTSGILENIVTIKYSDAITYEGQNYDVKVDVEKIIAENTSSQALVLIGFREDDSEENKYNLNSYTLGFFPAIAGDSYWTHLEIKVKYRILDKNGSPVSLNGVFGLNDVDGAQGIAVDNFAISENKNVFMSRDGEFYDVNDPNDRENILKYKTYDNGIYVYSDLAGDGQGTPGVDNVYLLMDNKNVIDVTFTFDQMATSDMVFLGEVYTKIHNYNRISTEVVGGTITPSITDIEDGENRTITYSPNDSSRQYLKSVIVDGVEQSVDLFENSYIFQNITDDHTIKVEYADLYKVIFDAKGGTPTPETQYVKGGETAVEPEKEPTKKGYIFEGWTLDGGSSPYNFAEPVNKDIKLVAKWKPIIYKIDYVLNGGTNDPDNPTTYTREDTIDFNPATREGYDFLGWYEDENFVTPIAGVSNRTGDITVYAKWEAKKDVAYKVEHYKETEPGKYELAVTDTLSGSTNEEVTALPKTYTGYEENKTHKDRIEKGSIKADGSLVLKLYYDKIKYTVTFDPQNDSKIPDQIVPYQDKATEPKKPTKKDNEFKGWYYTNEEGQEIIYNFDDPVTSDVHLIGKWAKIEKPVDATPAPTPIPQTGDFNPVMVFSIIATVTLAGAFGIKYLKFKRIIK